MIKKILIAAGLLLATVLSLTAGLALGSENLSIHDVFDVLKYRLSFGATEKPDLTTDLIVWRLRAPRVLLALIVGGGLSIVGVTIQALVRNPLAEPYILGISSGASAGASLFYLGFLPPVAGLMLNLPIAAFVGSLLSIVVVYLTARTGTFVSPARLLLAGVAVSALMSAVTSFVTLTSPSPYKMQAVLFWLMGSLSNTQWSSVALPAFTAIGGLVLLMTFSRTLDTFLIGEEPARSLGVSVEVAKRMLVLLIAIVTGTLVAFSGTIGFVGLIIPHAVRSIVGVTHRRLVPASFCAGALFLLWAAIAARTIISPLEIPIGILTAICGVPFFLVLLRRKRYHFG